MGQLNGAKINAATVGLYSCLDSADQDLVKNIVTRDKCELNVTDGGTAATAQTETFIYQNSTTGNVRVVSASVTTPIGVTADNTNNAVFNVFRRTSAGASQAQVAQLTTNAAQGNLVAFAPASMTLTPANIILAPGAVLTASVAKGGTGVAIGAATSQSRIEVLLEPSD